jgi:hypothetical protein
VVVIALVVCRIGPAGLPVAGLVELLKSGGFHRFLPVFLTIFGH